MNSEYEKIFVDNIVVKGKRKKLKSGLEKERKRKDTISKMCRDFPEYIDELKVIRQGRELTRNEIMEIINMYDPQKEAYIICWQDEYDGMRFATSQALGIIFDEGMASVMILKRLVIIKEEQGYGQPMIYVCRVD